MPGRICEYQLRDAIVGEGWSACSGNMQAAVCAPYARFKDVRETRQAQGTAAHRRPRNQISSPGLRTCSITKAWVPVSPRQIWDLLAIIAATLFLLDVAARRISLDPATVAAYFARISGRRSDASTDTVSAWKRTKSQVKHRKADKAAAEASPVDRQVRFEAGEADAKHAIDVTQVQIGDHRDKPQQPTRKPDEKPKAAEDDADYTSRLLKAKRRARGPDDPTTGSGGQDKPHG
jgi:hypothetical protein